MSTRIEGQIWIDKNSPYRLKYHTRGVDYEVSVSQVYDVDITEYDKLYSGMVVALDENGAIRRAVFPDDLENVIGIVGQKNDSLKKIAISKMDKLVLSAKDIANTFVDTEDIKLSELKGAPIYWFVGRQKKLSDGSFIYIDSSDNKGKLTFCTPSGYQWKQTEIKEDCFNVGYDNLPVIGTVGDIDYDENKIISIVINTNFIGFDKTIGWSYPYTENAELTRGVLTPDENNIADVDICHGLFPNSTTVKARCFCDVIAMPNGASDDTEYQVSAIIDNFYSTKEQETASEVRHTHIEVHTPDTYRYNIKGTVVYKFQKGAR